MDQPKALRIAVCPLEVVQQRPGEIAAQIDAALYGVQGSAQMVAQIVPPQGVIDPAIGLRRIVERRPVFGDI